MGASNKIGLDSVQVCSIIEACAKYGVAKLKYGDLEIELGPKVQQVPPEARSDLPLVPSAEAHITTTPEAAISEETHDRQTKEAIEDEELRLREEQIAELTLTDPLAAEEMIRNGELADVAGESESDDSNEV